MKLNIKELLGFFDDETESRGHATAIVGVLGEDLNASVFKHYLEERGSKVIIFDGPVTQGTKVGLRLDRWIYVESKNSTKTLYQCEIKSWSATAFGGRSLAINIDKENLKNISQYHWDQQKKVFSTGVVPNYVSKVFLRMNSYRNNNLKQYLEKQNIINYDQKPLLIYWMPISSDKKDSKPFFNEKVSNLDVRFSNSFKSIDIFSVSLYFRYLLGEGKEYIDLEMPHFEHRMKVITKFQK